MIFMQRPVEVRVNRLPHNHIFQGEHEDCTACAYIDPWHQTLQFVKQNFYARG